MKPATTTKSIFVQLMNYIQLKSISSAWMARKWPDRSASCRPDDRWLSSRTSRLRAHPTWEHLTTTQSNYTLMQFTSSRYLFDLSFTLLGAFVCFRRLPPPSTFRQGQLFTPRLNPMEIIRADLIQLSFILPSILLAGKQQLRHENSAQMAAGCSVGR